MDENNVFPEEQETLFSTEGISLQELEDRKEMATIGAIDRPAPTTTGPIDDLC